MPVPSYIFGCRTLTPRRFLRLSEPIPARPVYTSHIFFGSDRLTVSLRSGNPGYLFGKPVIFGRNTSDGNITLVALSLMAPAGLCGAANHKVSCAIEFNFFTIGL